MDKGSCALECNDVDCIAFEYTPKTVGVGYGI